MRTPLVLLVLSCVPTAPPAMEACVALTPQTVEVRFRERDGKQSSKLAAQGTVTRAENVVMSKPGAYARRTGSDAVATVTGAKELTAYSDALVTFSQEVGANTEYFLRQKIAGTFTLPASSSLRWTAVAATRSLETGDDQICHSHVRAADGRDWHVWETYNGSARAVKYSVVDPTTGAHIVHDATVVTGTRPYIVAVGTRILIFYVLGGSVDNMAANTSLMVATILQSAPTSISHATVDTTDFITPANDTFFASMPYDAIANGSTTVAVAYRVLDAGVAKTRVKTWDAALGSATATVTEATGQASTGHDVIGFLNHDFSDSNYYVGTGYVASATGFRTLLLQVAPTSLASVTNYTLKTEAGDIGAAIGWKNVTGFVDGSLTAHVLADVVNHAHKVGGSAAWKWYYYATRTSGGAIAATTRAGLGLASRPWLTGTDRFVLLSHTSYSQPTYFVADPTTGTIYGRIFASAAGLVDNENAPFVTSPDGGSYPERRSRLPAVQMSGTTAVIAVQKLRQAPPSVIAGAYKGGVSRGAWTVSIAPWAAGGEYQPSLSSDAMLITGGSPREFDGGSITESGYHLYPESPPGQDGGIELPSVGTGNSVDGFAAATGSMTAGTYFVQFVWEWLDSRGRMHRSVPSAPFALIISGTTGQTIKVMSPLTGRGIVRLVAYRTIVDAAVSAAYYRAGEAVATGLSSGSLFVSITLTEADATIQENEQLYTDDGTLENAPPPSMRQARPWKDRVMFLLEENRRAFGWSKLVKPDTGLEWSDSFFFEIADEYGDFTAIAPLGANFLLFKRDAVYWLSDQGPTDTGVGQFAEPRRLDGPPGTERPRSVVTTEEGVWYQAPDNVIWLITPSLERIPIGEPCADQTATVVGAMAVPDKRQVRFHTATTTLVRDTLHKVWTTFTGQASLACCMLGADAHYLTTGAAVRKDGTGYTEAGTTYQSVLELSWLSIAGLGGYQRVWTGDVVGEAVGAHSLSVVMTTDFGTGTSTKTVASSALAAAVGYRTRFWVPVSLQQKTALRLRLQDDSPSTAGGLWEGLNLQCGFAPGRRPQLPSAHRMT